LSKPSFTEYALLIFLACIWGFSFFFIKKGLLAFTPYQVGALRIFLSFISILPVWFFVREKIPREMIIPAIWMAMLGSGFPPFLFAVAESKISSALAGVLNSLTPLFVVGSGMFFFGSFINRRKAIGILLGFLGAVLVALTRADGSFEFNFYYAFLIVLATICYGFNANIIRKYGPGLSSLALTALIFTIIGPPAGIYLLMSDTYQRFHSSPFGWQSLGYLMILSWVGTALALVLFTILVKRTSALFASLTTYLIPIVAVIVGLLDGEHIGLYHIGGMVLILGGVFMTNKI